MTKETLKIFKVFGLMTLLTSFFVIITTSCKADLTSKMKTESISKNCTSSSFQIQFSDQNGNWDEKNIQCFNGQKIRILSGTYSEELPIMGKNEKGELIIMGKSDIEHKTLFDIRQNKVNVSDYPPGNTYGSEPFIDQVDQDFIYEITIFSDAKTQKDFRAAYISERLYKKKIMKKSKLEDAGIKMDASTKTNLDAGIRD